MIRKRRGAGGMGGMGGPPGGGWEDDLPADTGYDALNNEQLIAMAKGRGLPRPPDKVAQMEAARARHRRVRLSLPETAGVRPCDWGC